MDISELQAKVIQFRDERDWAQYHNPKDLPISLSLEASELFEVFQWKDSTQVEALKSNSGVRQRVKVGRLWKFRKEEIDKWVVSRGASNKGNEDNKEK